MNKISLENVTLLGIDCIDIERLVLAAEISQKYINFAEVKLLSSLDYDISSIFKIPPIQNIRDYSKFIVKELYKYIDTDYVLIIQWDGFVLNAFSWTVTFFEYDYIGAPWRHNDNFVVGNGGFSLRSKRLLKFIALDESIDLFHPEDFIICKKYRRYLEQHGFRFAPENIAREFSVESESWDGQFGFHQTDISKANISCLADNRWHCKLTETYVNLRSRMIEIQGKRH